MTKLLLSIKYANGFFSTPSNYKKNNYLKQSYTKKSHERIKKSLKEYDCWEVMLALFAGEYRYATRILNIKNISSFSHYFQIRGLQYKQVFAIQMMAGVPLEQADARYQYLCETNKWSTGVSRVSRNALFECYLKMMDGEYDTDPEMIKQLCILSAICNSETEEEAATLLDMSKATFLETVLKLKLSYTDIKDRYALYKQQCHQLNLTAPESQINSTQRMFVDAPRQASIEVCLDPIPEETRSFK